jgi:hypothetical protein
MALGYTVQYAEVKQAEVAFSQKKSAKRLEILTVIITLNSMGLPH